MKVLLICSRFNSLSQRFYCELSEKGYDVSVELDVHPELMVEAVELFKPDLVIAPYLRRKIPKEVYSKVETLIVHPGPPGDRGAYSLDWAILEERKEWGVCILRACEEYDAGDVYASRRFRMPFKRKSNVYRNEITEGAVECLWESLEKMESGEGPQPQKEGYFKDKPPFTLRWIEWEKDSTQEVIKKVHAFDSHPGAIAKILGEEYLIFNAHEESLLRGKPGEVIAYRGDAICVGTIDGAVWIGHLKRRGKEAIKLPATVELEDRLYNVSESVLEPWEDYGGKTYREIVYEEESGISIIHFNFYNGAMSKRHCQELLKTIRYAKNRNTKVLVLFGSEDFWSNGMHLNIIEHAESPADESWENINAMDDLCEELLLMTDKYVVCAMQGNAGAGGVFLALTGDLIIARKGIVLNPHYKNIGNLYGSEFWTYTLPKRVGWEKGLQIMNTRLPISADMARKLGLVDLVFDGSPQQFREKVKGHILSIIQDVDELLQKKKSIRERDEAIKPLRKYREEELQKMWQNFYGFDPSYHIARYYFVNKTPHYRTPYYLAKHRL